MVFAVIATLGSRRPGPEKHLATHGRCPVPRVKSLYFAPDSTLLTLQLSTHINTSHVVTWTPFGLFCLPSPGNEVVVCIEVGHQEAQLALPLYAETTQLAEQKGKPWGNCPRSMRL